MLNTRTASGPRNRIFTAPDPRPYGRRVGECGDGGLGERRLAFFFFGTLMDRDVLERVLGRPVPDEQLAPARLSGYRRVRAAAASYPTLMACEGGVVEGIVLRVASVRDEARILHFEEAEYEARVLPVHLVGDDRPLDARVFMALEAMGLTEEGWDLESWARAHKATFLVRCDEWLHDCPE